MGLTLTTATRNVLADALVDLIDVGTGNGTMQIVILASTEVATVTFGAPAFGAASSGVATANAITKDSSDTGNASPVDGLIVFDKDDLEVFRGTVALSGADLNLTDLTINATEEVDVTSMTVTQPAA